MANTVANVSAGKPRATGGIWRAPSGSTLPADASTALDAAFVCLGYANDDGVTNDYRKGVFRKTTITMSGESVVKVAFRAEGSYTDFVETVTVEMIRKDRSPFWVALGEKKLEHFLNRRKFDAAEEGWYYSQSKRAVLVKYPNPKQDTTLTVSFEDFDLIGM